jgi:hypothetical protein
MPKHELPLAQTFPDPKNIQTKLNTKISSNKHKVFNAVINGGKII